MINNKVLMLLIYNINNCIIGGCTILALIIIIVVPEPELELEIKYTWMLLYDVVTSRLKEILNKILVRQQQSIYYANAVQKQISKVATRYTTYLYYSNVAC